MDFPGKTYSISRIEALNPNKFVNENIDLIEVFLMRIYREQRDSSVDHALNKIIHQNGFVYIGEMAQIACLSVAQYRKRFNEEVGMSPKEYSKIIRIKYISSFLQKNPDVKLTDLTYELGYFDQSHFIRDFKSVTGQSPKQLLI